MDAASVNKATDALVTATKNEAVSYGKGIDTNLARLAPGLENDSNAPGGYNYQRNTAPIVPVLTKSLVVSAKQELLKNLIKKAIYSAQNKYDTAKYSYQARQRKFNQAQARKTRERYAASDRAQAAYTNSLNNPSGSTKLATSTPGGKVVAKTRSAGGGSNKNPQSGGRNTGQTYNPQQAGRNVPKLSVVQL